MLIRGGVCETRFFPFAAQCVVPVPQRRDPRPMVYKQTFAELVGSAVLGRLSGGGCQKDILRLLLASF